MAITAAMVKELRDKTDAGMMECKKALTETDGNMEAAIEYLRKSGMAKSAKRADKVTKEGKVYVASNGAASVMVEILCETDFVAKNDKFFDYVKEAADRILAATSGDGDITDKAVALEENNLKELFVKFGEKMVLRRAVRYEDANGKIASYIHGNGRVCIMIDAQGCDDEKLLRDICMHIAAFSPAYIAPEDVPAEVIAKEKEIASVQLAEQKKPADMIEKIVGGKINKWYTEVCLMKQPWIHDDKTCLAKMVPALKVIKFARWMVGQEL